MIRLPLKLMMIDRMLKKEMITMMQVLVVLLLLKDLVSNFQLKEYRMVYQVFNSTA